jgi:hypothetical protein
MTGYTQSFGIVVAVMALGCQSPSPTAAGDPGSRSPALDVKYANPELDPGNFVSTITNPYLPLVPGTAFHYRSQTPDGVETSDVIITRDTKQILDVTVTVVHDRVFLDGDLTEDTFDWFAQDRDGNVWYFGEDSKEIQDGEVVSTEGSWEAGVGGNEPGVVMLAHPKTGLVYRQELAPDIAEDAARVLSLKAKVDVPYGQFTGCLHTLEYTPLELGVREHKFYCPDIGQVMDVQPKGGRIRNELISISHF